MPMSLRLSRVARHLSHRPLPTFGQAPASAWPRTFVMDARKIKTAACLVIGDEVLGGKHLQRIEVIADEESEIIEAVRRMSDRYDLVVTRTNVRSSQGKWRADANLGRRHDDITYQCIAKAFGLPLVLHQETYERMKRLAKLRPEQANFNWDEDSPSRRAKLRMAELPTDDKREPDQQVVFPQENLWVPVSIVNGNIHILPVEQLLDGLKPRITERLADPECKEIFRIMIYTPMPESEVAPYLTELAAQLIDKGVKVGSYPRWGKKHNTVTLVGKDKAMLDSITPEVLINVKGRLVPFEIDSDDENFAK